MLNCEKLVALLLSSSIVVFCLTTTVYGQQAESPQSVQLQPNKHRAVIRLPFATPRKLASTSPVALPLQVTQPTLAVPIQQTTFARQDATTELSLGTAGELEPPMPHQDRQAIDERESDAEDEAPFELNELEITPVAPAPVQEISLDPAIEAMVAGYSLEQLQNMALSCSPTINSALFEIERVEGIRVQSSIKPNPVVGYFGSQIADAGTDQHGVFFEQQFVRGNKLELNQQLLNRSVQVSQNQLMLVQQKVLTDVQKLFYQTAAAQLKIQLINDFMVVARRGVKVAEDRKKAEEASQIEVLQAKTLLSEVEMSLKQAEAFYRGVRSNLANVVGLPTTSEFYVAIDLPKIQSIPDWKSQLAVMYSNSPELSVARAKLCEAEAFLQRQQAQATPNLTAQLGAGVDNGTNSGMINLQFSAPIPVRNRNQGNIAAARAAYQKAALEVERVQRSIANRLAELAASYESQLASVENLTKFILPQINETLDLSEQAYVAGELDFLQVAVIRKNLYESQIRWIDARLALSQSQARLDGLMLEGAFDTGSEFGNEGMRDQALTGE